ncbi:MAG: Type II secretion system F domain protein [Candidatus Moranbacteria bacterium GW2011_GWF2_36_839]|nr:MAG: Type II secretion system F domain protein [Candidatus Moranbacteria bacterium GW2011_GWF1_36_78]KKQ17472.1 MAG: Type II secretion system F domain protein [Candidatus Moranbacteria bacterium GW2011_GWF2_36_839]
MNFYGMLIFVASRYHSKTKMAKIFYSAKNYNGETKQGELDVKNERELATELRADGFILTSFKEIIVSEREKAQVNFLNRFIRISLTDKLMFARNLSVMIASGLPLSRAIKNISLQTEKKKFAQILMEIYEEIQAGNAFADALAKYPGIFDDLFVNMIRVGEVSGNLEEVLNILALQLEKEHELMSKVKGALTYPAVILVVMIGIGIVMLTYVLPKLMGVFRDMDVVLPASTRFIIALSDIFQKHGILVALFFISIIVFLRFFMMMEAGKKTLGFLLINMPAIKNIVIKVNCSRFARIYSSLLKSGVSSVESLKILSETLTNYYYQNAMKDCVVKIQKGIALSAIVSKYPKIFPVLVCQMIQVGEETGKTETVLLKLAEFYEDEVSQITKNMSSIIEPILMVFIGAAVGFFAISMLQPMYSIMDNIK